MKVFRSAGETQKWADSIRAEQKSIGFVPTMGALHVAHAELVKRARAENDFVVVSIFVNPTQFSPEDDYDSYPRDFEEDSRLCRDNGVDIIFYPEVPDMYLKDSSTVVEVTGITETMCGRYRPGHFEGVATVVVKLFNIVKPHRVYLGQKDYQQYRVIERMARDLDFGIELIICPTVREKDGLAVSSRNKYLNEQQRTQAAWIYRALIQGEKLIDSGEKKADIVNEKIKDTINKNIQDCRIDYAGVYDAYSLKPVDVIETDVVIAASVWLGKARLIDNVLVKRS